MASSTPTSLLFVVGFKCPVTNIEFNYTFFGENARTKMKIMNTLREIGSLNNLNENEYE